MKRLLLLGILLTLIPTATALNLADYPSQFIEDGNFDGLIVVGENAPSQDVASAVELIPALQAESEERVRGSTIDSKVTDPEYETENIISLGCENKITERITGMTCDDFTPTRGYIYFFESEYGNAHLVIAGGTPSDTEKAATLLGKHNEYNLTGNAYIVEMEDDLIETKLPKIKTKEEKEQETEKEIEEEIQAIQEKAREEAKKQEENDDDSREKEQLEAKIDRLLEEPEIKEEQTDKQKEQPAPVDQDAPLLERMWNGFTNWLGWFFN